MSSRINGRMLVPSDGADIFERQFDFIQRSGIVFAMTGMLQAPPCTDLYRRMAQEGRLLGSISGDNINGDIEA
jgi:hypothetical protein